jgi:cephalosporin hydroxylase
MSDPAGDIASMHEAYHHWYYNTRVWAKTRYAGIPVSKSPSDMWNYQEIISELRPALVIEFGTSTGASALFFSHTMTGAGITPCVLTVDVDPSPLYLRIATESSIETMTASSTEPRVAERIAELRREHPGPVFAILDSDHRCEHVLAEMLLLQPLLRRGDYLIVEDANINGHPVLPGWGAGPFEAVEAYKQRFPNDYDHDAARERKFGFTFATNGFLRRR